MSKQSIDWPDTVTLPETEVDAAETEVDADEIVHVDLRTASRDQLLLIIFGLDHRCAEMEEINKRQAVQLEWYVITIAALVGLLIIGLVYW